MTLRSFPPDPSQPLADEPKWPELGSGRPVVVLADAPTKLERRILRSWIDRHRPADTHADLLFLIPTRRRRPGQKTDPALAARLQRGDNPWVVPLRLVWRAGEHHGSRSASWIDVVKLGDPRDPDQIRQHIILWKDPTRVTIVAGAGASAGELVSAHRTSADAGSLVDFVTRRAHLALGRAERAERGNRYKVPKFVNDEILQRSEFRDGVLRVASQTGMAPEVAFAKARYYVREVAATHSPFLIDLIANAIHWVYRQGYGAILYDPAAVRDIAALGEEHPIVFLPSHRSNLDKLSLQYLLWENDLPPNHTAAGINMNFFPVGPLIRRTGSFFIRRTFKDNELYKFVVRSYLDFLVERRFPLEWYMEGGRSRSGKLLAPKYGMLGWVVESVRAGKADDLYIIPTSITYDQIQDVADYASEAQGGSKKAESFGWALGAVRSLRMRSGNIHVRFAEPLSVAKEIPLGTDDDVSIELQKLAFEVMHRISQVTPITPTSVVAIALLSTRGAAIDLDSLTKMACEVEAYVENMQFPVTEPFDMDRPGQINNALAQLRSHGSVADVGTPGAALYRLTGSQALQAAYYRNTVIHFFIPGAIAELAILAADDLDPVPSTWASVSGLRDLLKFEFFFPEREAFTAMVADELMLISESWESDLGGDRSTLLERAPLLRAHWALLPFLESYQIVADELLEADADIDEKAFLSSCLERGKRYLIEGTVGADESVSQILFKSAYGLARVRGLLDEDGETVALRRAWAEEIAAYRALAQRVGDVAFRRVG